LETRFYIDAWSALAPGLDTIEAWQNWLVNPAQNLSDDQSISLKSISPMIRRRFRTLGKYAVGSALPLLKDNESIPSIFSSRHGDTPVTLSLLEDIGRGEAISPTAFSLAVHNAVGGLFSIARKDTSAITSIAPTEYLVFQTLCEALGQLQNVEKLLCVIYDVPLPEFFSQYEDGDSFPYAIAMIISRSGRQAFELEDSTASVQESGITPSKDPGIIDPESFSLIKMLTGLPGSMDLGPKNNGWSLRKIECL